MILKAMDLRPGDVVKLLPITEDAFCETVVEKVEKDECGPVVTFFRPYVVVEKTILGDNQCNPLIGIERYRVPLHGGHQYLLVARRT